MGGLAGKVALVTGTGRKKGIGRAIALRLARDGADLVVTDLPRSMESSEQENVKERWWLDDLVGELKSMGRNAFAITADLRNSQQINNMVSAALDRFNRIDILVNNAARLPNEDEVKPVTNLEESVWREHLDVNLTAPFLICKLLAKNMIERAKGGRIINVASVEGRMAQSGRSAYCASKFGLIGLTQSLALELGTHRINVNAICPGAINTWARRRGRQIRNAMNEGASEEEAIRQAYSDLLRSAPLARVGLPEEIAGAVAFLASDDADFITGQAIMINGGRVMF